MQTRQDREYILQNLPDGTRRVCVVNATGKQSYKRPEDIDLDLDEIALNGNGEPVIMRGSPGRKARSTTLPPVTPQVAAVLDAREEHVEHDGVLKEIKKNPESDDAFNLMVQGMALEASILEFERTEAQRHGQDVTEHAVKRARVLKAMAELSLKKRSMFQTGMIDMDSPQFKALFKYLLESFKGALKESGARSEMVESVFNHLVKGMDDDWNQEAKRRMKEAAK